MKLGELMEKTGYIDFVCQPTHDLVNLIKTDLNYAGNTVAQTIVILAKMYDEEVRRWATPPEGKTIEEALADIVDRAKDDEHPAFRAALLTADMLNLKAEDSVGNSAAERIFALEISLMAMVYVLQNEGELSQRRIGEE